MPDNRLTGRRLRLGERPALPPSASRAHYRGVLGRRPVEEGLAAAAPGRQANAGAIPG
jgi:hypothetical protein